MDRLGFFKQGFSSAADVVGSIVGLKKAVGTFTEAVDEALSDIKGDIGLFLRSLDSDMSQNAKFTLQEIARMGYTTVELDAYYNGKIYGMKPDDFRAACQKAGLKIEGAHLNKFSEAQLAAEDAGGTEGPEIAQSSVISNGSEGAQRPEIANGSEGEQRSKIANGSKMSASAMTVKNAEYAEGAKNANVSEVSEQNKPTVAEDPALEWWNKALDVHRDLGCLYITSSRLPEAPTAQTVAHYAAYFDKIGERATQRGMKFCYHPNRAELTATDGVSTFDTIASATDKTKVWFEIDTLEAAEAGIDVCDLIKHYRNRILLLHIRDYGILGESGRMDFDKIVSEGVKHGVKDLFIEVRNYTLPPMNCVERSKFALELLPSIRY